MKRIVRLTEKDLTRIVRRVINENSISEIYKIVTPEEIKKFETDLIDLFDEYLSDGDERRSNLQHKFNLWKTRHVNKYIRRPSKRFNDEIEYDELSKYEKEEWKTLRKTNVEMIGKLFEELISNYENEYNSIEEDSKIKNRIKDIMDVLYFDYITYFEHIMYSDKHE